MLDIGVDIIAIDRIQAILKSEKSEKFKKKIFSNNEIIESKKKHSESQYFSGRFAAKEAIRKALYSKSRASNHSFKSIEILNSKNGKPYISSDLNHDVNISISHDGNYAVAFCVVNK